MRRGRAVAQMPATTQAWADGEIGTDHVDVLAGAAGGGRADLFARDEALLVSQCAELTFGQAVKAMRYSVSTCGCRTGPGRPPAGQTGHLPPAHLGGWCGHR